MYIYIYIYIYIFETVPDFLIDSATNNVFMFCFVRLFLFLSGQRLPTTLSSLMDPAKCCANVDLGLLHNTENIERTRIAAFRLYCSATPAASEGAAAVPQRRRRQ